MVSEAAPFQVINTRGLPLRLLIFSNDDFTMTEQGHELYLCQQRADGEVRHQSSANGRYNAARIGQSRAHMNNFHLQEGDSATKNR